MPLPPPPHFTTALLLTLLLLLLLFASPTAAHTCKQPQSTCPPFNSTLPFPFSSSPGCGHPSFQIQCSSPHSIITINNLSFSLLSYEPNSTSLILSPHPSTKSSPSLHNCSSPHFSFIPNQPINLSGSPFQVSDSSCSRLSALKPCLPPNLPNCSHCPYQCKLVKNPVQILHDCGSTHRSVSEQGCQGDVLGFLENFMELGVEVEWVEDQENTYFSKCKVCKTNNGVCGFNVSDPQKQFMCFPSHSQSRISSPWIYQNNHNQAAILSLVFLILCLLFISVATIIFRSRNRSLPAEEDPTIVFLRRHRSANLLPPVFSYEELETSTNRFDPKRKIGDGGFGSVYLGQLYDGRIVAVKHLHRHHPTTAAGAKAFSAKSFCNEILILSSIEHPNLVKLHGYCSDPRGLLLVYDYVPNGTLADHLHGTKSLYRKGSLTWQVRVDVALQTAMAIEYLHFSVIPPIVHRDITSSNIFVERDMRIKVGDFGLSRLLVLPETTAAAAGVGGSSGCVWTGPQGTPGYLDPDYYRSFRLTEKSDVYSFGVVLLELITGLKAVDQRREKREMALADMVVSKIQMGLLYQVVDPVLVVDGEAVDGVGAVAELAFRCVAADKDDRPDAKEVVAELRRIRSRTRVVIVRSTNAVVPDDHQSDLKGLLGSTRGVELIG